MPEDPEKERELQDRLEKIEDEYELTSAPGIIRNRFGPISTHCVAFRTDLRQEFPEAEEGKSQQSIASWCGEGLKVGTPGHAAIHDEEDAFAF